MDKDILAKRIRANVKHQDDMIEHYGKMGMKWGQRKAAKALKKSGKLTAKAYKPMRRVTEKKVAKQTVKREKAVALQDMANRVSAKHIKKSQKLIKKIDKRMKKGKAKEGDDELRGMANQNIKDHRINQLELSRQVTTASLAQAKASSLARKKKMNAKRK